MEETARRNRSDQGNQQAVGRPEVDTEDTSRKHEIKAEPGIVLCRSSRVHCEGHCEGRCQVNQRSVGRYLEVERRNVRSLFMSNDAALSHMPVFTVGESGIDEKEDIDDGRNRVRRVDVLFGWQPRESNSGSRSVEETAVQENKGEPPPGCRPLRLEKGRRAKTTRRTMIGAGLITGCATQCPVAVTTGFFLDVFTPWRPYQLDTECLDGVVLLAARRLPARFAIVGEDANPKRANCVCLNGRRRRQRPSRAGATTQEVGPKRQPAFSKR